MGSLDNKLLNGRENSMLGKLPDILDLLGNLPYSKG